MIALVRFSFSFAFFHCCFLSPLASQQQNYENFMFHYTGTCAPIDVGMASALCAMCILPNLIACNQICDSICQILKSLANAGKKKIIVIQMEKIVILAQCVCPANGIFENPNWIHILWIMKRISYFCHKYERCTRAMFIKLRELLNMYDVVLHRATMEERQPTEQKVNFSVCSAHMLVS